MTEMLSYARGKVILKDPLPDVETTFCRATVSFETEPSDSMAEVETAFTPKEVRCMRYIDQQRGTSVFTATPEILQNISSSLALSDRMGDSSVHESSREAGLREAEVVRGRDPQMQGSFEFIRGRGREEQWK